MTLDDLKVPYDAFNDRARWRAIAHFGDSESYRESAQQSVALPRGVGNDRRQQDAAHVRVEWWASPLCDREPPVLQTARLRWFAPTLRDTAFRACSASTVL